MSSRQQRRRTRDSMIQPTCPATSLLVGSEAIDDVIACLLLSSANLHSATTTARSHVASTPPTPFLLRHHVGLRPASPLSWSPPPSLSPPPRCPHSSRYRSVAVTACEQPHLSS